MSGIVVLHILISHRGGYLLNVQIATDKTLRVIVNQTSVQYRGSVPTSTVRAHVLCLEYYQQLFNLAGVITVDGKHEI